MPRIKKYTGIGLGILTASASILMSSTPKDTDSDENDSVQHKEYTLQTTPQTPILIDTVKRKPQKIYHRFEEIPEISDKEALLYNKSEYTYIINADEYQKSGKIELKRVLIQEITKANLISLIYRSEGKTYNPQENEDQMTHYVVDMKVINPSGNFKGPTQMDDVAVTSFIKYLAISPNTRQQVLPLLKYSVPRRKDAPKTLDSALIVLEKIFYDENVHLRPLNVRKDILHNKTFQNIHINTGAWQKLASPELKNFITREERRRGKTLSGTTKCFLCLSELIPDKNTLVKELETYNLTTYPIGRKGIPKQIMMTLAHSLNLKNNQGNLDATRIPFFTIAASISTVNWHGNGLGAISEAKQFAKTYANHPNDYNQQLKQLAKKWVTGKSRLYGIDELSQMNMITPALIEQFQTMELPGAEYLASEYAKAVRLEETKIQAFPKEQSVFAQHIQRKNKQQQR